jgi:ATP-dependent DNA ligase I
MSPVLLADVVSVSRTLAQTRSRSAKVQLVAEALRSASEDVRIVASYLAGVIPQRRVGVGWRGLSGLPQASEVPSLTVAQVDSTFDRLAAASGTGSAGVRLALVTSLFQAATPPEQDFLRALITGALRQGALDGVMLSAIAKAFAVPEEAVRRAAMLSGHTATVAGAAWSGGLPALNSIGLAVGHPVRPMLAASASSIGDALAGMGADQAYLDCKLDGIRLQAHKTGAEVRLFTRSLEDITDRLPEIVEVVQGIRAERVVLDGEAIALRPDGRPEPFQVTGARTASSSDPDALRRAVPLTAYFFDVLHSHGTDLIDLPARERFAELERLVPSGAIVPRILATGSEQARGFFADVVEQGHEGVVVKAAGSPYAAGRRGSGWVKVKPRHTLDLVVLGVEWGSGRRRGFLSNIHLGARDPQTGSFVMLGKTFKGMTDAMLKWQTERFLALETTREGHIVWVRPEQVVEVAFDGLQRSSRYPGGVALRFARVLRYRDDKRAAEADTLETVLALGSF